MTGLRKLTRADVERIVAEARAKSVRPDLRGQQFGSLTVIEFAGTLNQKRRWLCVCVCGAETIVPTHHLRSGNTTSCGCAARLALGARSRRHGYAGPVKIPEYIVWEGMVRRCHNPKATNYRYYGAKGVRVCDAWRGNFAAFFAYVGPRPSAGHSIDRINPFGGYEPGNVRWVTRAKQDRNKRCDQARIAAEWDATHAAEAEAVES